MHHPDLVCLLCYSVCSVLQILVLRYALHGQCRSAASSYAYHLGPCTSHTTVRSMVMGVYRSPPGVEVLYIPTSIPVRACRVHTHPYHVPYHDVDGALMRQTHLRRALPGLLPGRILEMQMLWSRMGAGSLVQRYTYRYGDIPDTV